MENIFIKMPCDMLIDQDVYIDDMGSEDPVGFKCMQNAEFTDGHYLFCKQCTELLKTEPGRVTIPTLAPWKERFEILRKDFVNQIFEDLINIQPIAEEAFRPLAEKLEKNPNGGYIFSCPPICKKD